MNSNAAPDPPNIQPSIDWDIITAPQKVRLHPLHLETSDADGFKNLNDRKLQYSQGRTFSGSSGRNNGVYQRGTKGAYKQWTDLVSDDSYTFDNILPYFKESITLTPPNFSKLGPGVPVPYAPAAFCDGRPVHVSYNNFCWPFSPAANDAFKKLGLGTIDGFNSGNLIGYGHITDTVDPAAETRSSAESGFL